MRRHGLREAHSRPFVSFGKDAQGVHGAVFRENPDRAWAYPEIELRTGCSWPAVILDLDQRYAYENLCWRISEGAVPAPNWTVIRGDNGHCHAVYTLSRPVLRGPKARKTPLRAFRRVSEWMALVTEADSGYTGILTHNPMQRAVMRNPADWETKWGPQRPYTLAELGRAIPKGWRVPPMEKLRTVAGRNCAIFDQGVKWASRNREMDIMPYLQMLNDQLLVPLPYMELRGIGRSIDRYRAKWAAGQHSFEFLAKQSARGKASGKARRAKVQERDETIRQMHKQGQSQRSIGRHFGIDHRAVAHVLKRAAVSGE